MTPAFAYKKDLLPGKDKEGLHISGAIGENHGKPFSFLSRSVVDPPVGDPVEEDLLPNLLIVPDVGNVDAVSGRTCSGGHVFPIPVRRAGKWDLTLQRTGQIEDIDGGVMTTIVVAEQECGLGSAEGGPRAFLEDFGQPPGLADRVAPGDARGVPAAGSSQDQGE